MRPSCSRQERSQPTEPAEGRLSLIPQLRQSLNNAATAWHLCADFSCQRQELLHTFDPALPLLLVGERNFGRARAGVERAGRFIAREDEDARDGLGAEPGAEVGQLLDLIL